jgi:hypothetical protein
MDEHRTVNAEAGDKQEPNKACSRDVLKAQFLASLISRFTVPVQFQLDRVSLPIYLSIRSHYDRCPLSFRPLAEGQHHGNSR